MGVRGFFVDRFFGSGEAEVVELREESSVGIVGGIQGAGLDEVGHVGYHGQVDGGIGCYSAFSLET